MIISSPDVVKRIISNLYMSESSSLIHHTTYDKIEFIKLLFNLKSSRNNILLYHDGNPALFHDKNIGINLSTREILYFFREETTTSRVILYLNNKLFDEERYKTIPFILDFVQDLKKLFNENSEVETSLSKYVRRIEPKIIEDSLLKELSFYNYQLITLKSFKNLEDINVAGKAILHSNVASLPTSWEDWVFYEGDQIKTFELLKSIPLIN